MASAFFDTQTIGQILANYLADVHNERAPWQVRFEVKKGIVLGAWVELNPKAKRYTKAELRRAAKGVCWDHGGQPHSVQAPRSRRRRR